MASTMPSANLKLTDFGLSRPQFLHLSNGNVNRLYLIGVMWVGFKQEKESKILAPSEDYVIKKVLETWS